MIASPPPIDARYGRPMQAPDIFDYTDFRRFLQVWFQWRKASNRRYSHRQFIRRLGSSDPSLLINILKDRRKLPARQVADFVRVLGLEGEAAQYFGVLVRFGQAEDEGMRGRAWAELAELRSRLHKPEIDETKLRYLSERTYPIVQALAECAGFQPDPTWVAERLEPPTTPEVAAEALALLERLGILVRKGGGVVVSEPTLRTETTVENLGTMAYHAQNMDVGRQVLEEVRLSAPVQHESAFVGATLSIPSDRLPELRRLLYEHLGQIIHHVKATWPEADRVVQVNVQMFPASRKTTS